MAPAPQTLFGLLGDPTAGWPSEIVHEHTGYVALGDVPSPGNWLHALDDSVLVRNIRPGASQDRVAVEAELGVDPAAGFASYSEGWPFVIASMPDVEFRVRPYTDPAHATRLFASMGDDGPELLLEGLPVEIRLPVGLIQPHPDEPGDPVGELTIAVGEFVAGRLDDLMVIYRRTEPTSVFVHIRLYMNADLEFDIQPAVPVSFRRCALSGIPCRAVHDFRLIPSPALARDRHEWLRHGIEPWLPSHTASYDGMFAVRSADIDEDAKGLTDAVGFLNEHSRNKHPAAELVLADMVVPFHGPFWLPVPRHLTAGIRRNVMDPADKEAVYAFDRAPVHIDAIASPKVAFNVESLFYRSLPAPEGLEDDLGLTFDVAVVWGEDASPNNALGIGLEEDYTLVARYRRDFGADGSLARGEPPQRETNELLHIEIAGFVIADILGFNLGFSFGRKFGQGKSVWDSMLATFDAWVSMPPTGASDTTGFRLRGLNGEKVAFAVEGVGWRFGSVNVEGASLPDGVVAYFGSLGFVFSEIGLTQESGASYLSFSGGLLIPKPADLSGALTVRRLRGRMAGDAAQPKWKLDGLFLRLESGTTLIEAGGYYTESEADGTEVSEYGFTGLIDFVISKRQQRLGVDIVRGERKSDTEHFTYFMVQAFYRGQIGPFGGIELRSARVLYASDMVPKLAPVAGESRELRYYKWYLESDPLTVPGDRRLASWKPSAESWALGVGASASFVSLGRLVELDAFVLGVRGPEERGLLVSARLFIMSNKEPLGFLAIEFDRANGRTSAVLAIDATLDKFMENAPAWMAEAGGFTGTLFLSNEPDTLAIGRLADQSTWLALRFDVDRFVEASLVIGFCLELVEDGPKGFGLTVRLEGLIGKKGVIALTFHAGFGAVVLVFTTGSTDYSASIWIEAAIRFVLFGFLRVGVSARMDFRVVGSRPARAELTAEIRLETPWFLPDVTWRLDCQFGELAPAQLATSAPPLRSVAATEPGTGHQLPAHVERFDPAWDGAGVAPVYSVEELRAPARPEPQRLANLAADAALRPVATDATISVEWSVPVNDKLGLGSGMGSGLGDQRSGDLALTYDLVAIAVRRRARFGPDRAWKPLDQRVELGADFSDPGGVQLDGEFAPQVLSKTWDLDLLVEGESAPKKLLINGVAPYEFATADPELDERLVRRHPAWPCCERPDDKDLHELFHRAQWRSAAAGVDLGLPAASVFSDSTSTLRFLRPAWTHPVGFAGLPVGVIVAGPELGPPGVVARADLDEGAAFCSVRMAWPRGVLATLVAFDGAGKEVGRRDLGSGGAAFVSTLLGAQGPIRRLELRAFRPPGHASVSSAATSVGTLLEVDEVAYVGLRDYLDLLTAQAACDDDGGGGFEGKGKLALLANHEYELQFTTRVTVAHPSAPAEAADVDEFVYVRTKGLPGLNAVARVGEELDPYVRGAYAGGRGGRMYREEPVTLAFSEDFHVAVPLALRPPGSAAEHTTLLRMQLLVTPEVALRAGSAYTATAEDWIVAHRGSGVPPVRGELPWFAVGTVSRSDGSGMVTTNPMRHRLAAMTQRAAVPCAPADPRNVIGTVLVAPPQGEGAPPDELWPAGARFTAAVRAQGAGFVDRRPFTAGDQTAFARAGGGSWSVVDGELHVDGAGVAVFGEPDWDHLTAAAVIAGGGAAAGVGFGVGAAGAAPRGLFATVDRARLVVSRRETDGGALVEVGAADLPDAGDALALEATAFDDRLRAAVGEAVVEVDRGELRAGRLCLIAAGPAAFRSLEVHGLDMYRFPFAVSRFRSFEEHIGSWSGRLDEVAPDALGPGTTTETVAGLLAATGAEVAAAMTPAAPAADRERVFAAWVSGLGLPLTVEVTELELSRFVDPVGTHALLVESPEPLDFTQDINVALTRRTRTGPFPPERPDVGGPLVVEGGAAAAPPRPGVGPARESLRERLEAVTRRPPAGRRSPGRPGIDDTILNVDILRPGLRLALHPALANAGELSVVGVGADGAAQVYRGPVRPGILPGAPANLAAALIGPLPALPHGSELAEPLAGAPPGLVLLATNDLRELLGRHRLLPAEVDVPVPVLIVQSGDGRRALVVRASGAPFATGPHRLTLTLSRRRWDTTDPADDLNTYTGEVTLTLTL